MHYPQGITGEELARMTRVSSRTIRSDMKKIQEALAGNGSRIISAPNKGYKLCCFEDSEDLLNILFNEKSSSLDDSAGRNDFIISRLLECTFSDEAITQMELAEEMFLGLSTLKMQLNNVKEELKKYSLEIVQYKTEGIRLQGTEGNLRYCISEYLTKNHNTILYQKIFSDISMTEMDAMLQRVLNMRNLQLTDAAKTNLCIHAALAVQRSKLNKIVSYPVSIAQNLESNFEYSIAKDIIKELFRQTGVDVSFSEVYYITQCLLTSKRIANEGDFVNKEHVRDLVKKILQEVRDKLSLDFTEDKYLIDGLSLHLSIAMARVEFHMNIRNELLKTIKQDYPMAFQMGILAGKVVMEIDHIEFNENEIGYIALHFGAAISRNGIKGDVQPKIVVIVCSAGLGVAVLLKAKIEEYFHERINVTRIIPKYEINNALLDEVDFVFTTVPLENINSSKIIQINHMLKQNDISRIEQVVFRKSMIQVEDIKRLLDVDNFYVGKSFDTKEECLNFLTDKLIEKGLMSEETKKSVFEREKLSATAIGEWTAIPHPIYNDIAASSISVLILDRPVKWDDTTLVQVVFLLNIEKDKGSLWETIFLKLYHYIKEQNGIKSMLQQKSYDMFLNDFLKSFK
jgi:Transcriptional antiterminator